MAHALGIDVGTTNVKVALTDAAGACVAAGSRPVDTVRRGDAVEQDAEQLWAAVVGAVRETVGAAGAAAADVAAVGVCSQYSSIVPVDAELEPTGPLVLYLDQRGTDRSWAIMAEHPDAFETWLERHGIPPVGSGLSLGHLLALQHDAPEQHAATTAYLEPMDFVTARLTGRVAATQCTTFTSQLCDNRTVGTTDYDERLVELSGVDPRTLPPLVAPEAVLGPLRPETAELLGLPGAAQVVAGMNDSQAAALATGVVGAHATRPGHYGVMIGTTSVVLAPVEAKRQDLENELVSMPCPTGGYLAWAENGVAGKAVEHVLGLLAQPGADPFAGFDQAVASAPAGSGGVLFLPWFSGSVAPQADPAMRGGFLNLSFDTTREHLCRAAAEGVALNLRWLLPAVEAFTGRPATELVLGGGVARSAAWSQVLADVLDRPVSTLRDSATSVAAAVGRHALDLVEPSGAAPGPVALAARFDPTPGTRERYAQLASTFVAAFEATRPIATATSGSPSS